MYLTKTKLATLSKTKLVELAYLMQFTYKIESWSDGESYFTGRYPSFSKAVLQEIHDDMANGETFTAEEYKGALAHHRMLDNELIRWAKEKSDHRVEELKKLKLDKLMSKPL